MTSNHSRRQWLAATSAAFATGIVSTTPAGAADKPKEQSDPFIYGLNTSTLPGKLTLIEKIDITARAGYGGIEPWVRELEQHVKSGGNLKDVGKRLSDNGLSVESSIGFFDWVVDDDEKRKKGLEEARRSMDLVQQIGGKRIAAPATGATNQTDLNLFKAADRYRALLEVSDKIGVVPEVELWGHSKTLSKLGEVVFIALESAHPKACILLDVYHLYKGGAGYDGLKFLSGSIMHNLHMNDYPAKPLRAEIKDEHRIYPGDGVAPLKTILRDLRAIGYRGMLSLELFNKEYWMQDPLAVAKLGLEKMKAAVKSSME